MLKRFQLISGVGCYSACRAPQVQFEPMSLVYGENCYGKSTLCDILRSLSENDSTYITNRITIPSVSGIGQQIQLSVKVPSQTQETTLTFRQGVWNQTLPAPLRLEVFDTDFIHRNVFTGLSISRQNYENITRFVLGDTGVQIATRIAEISSEIRSLKKKLRDAEAGEFRDISDLQNFLALPCPADITVIDRDIVTRSASLESDKQLSSNLDSVRDREEPSLHPEISTIAPKIEAANRFLSSSYEQVHRDAEALLLKHFENHTTDAQKSRKWVRQGKTLIKDNECPFCGQKFVGDATALIKAYQEVFNDSFERYINDTVSGLEQTLREIMALSYPNLLLKVEKNRNACSKYPEMKSKPGIRNLMLQANELSNEVIRLHQLWTTTLQRYSQALEGAVKEKKESVLTVVPFPNSEEVIQQNEVLVQSVEKYNLCIRAISEEIAKFKVGLNSAQVKQRIEVAESAIRDLNMQKRRHVSDAACRSYQETKSQLATLETEITRLREELDNEQSAFLGRYFDTINRIFSGLGSNRFSIAAETSRRGNMPTIQLRVSYNGVSVTQDKLCNCFSESDRRALAFAIFWSRLELFDQATRNHTIVVLDDPVTSFDDGRIDRTIRLIELQLPNLRQTIICSHYSAYLKTFFTRIRGQQAGVLLSMLCQDAQGTQIKRASPLDFTETDHQRAYRRISTFISRENQNDIFQDLRVFLETEVRSRYHRAIVENNLYNQQFVVLLDELVHKGELLPDTRNLIEPLRLTLNTDHHVWMERSHEEKIGIASDVIKFVYDNL